MYIKGQLLRFIILFYFCLQVSTLAQQMYPGKGQRLLEAYKDATKEPYGYLVINLLSNTDYDTRLSTNILPGEFPIVYLPKD